MYGSGAFRPLTHAEWVDWVALYDLEAKEREAADRKARRGKRARDGQGGAPMPRTLDRARHGEAED